MTKTVLLYFIYAVVILFIFIILFVSFAPQFGSNPSFNQKKYYNIFPNYKDGDLVNKTIFKYSYFSGNLKSEKKYEDGKCISGC